MTKELTVTRLSRPEDGILFQSKYGRLHSRCVNGYKLGGGFDEVSSGIYNFRLKVYLIGRKTRTIIQSVARDTRKNVKGHNGLLCVNYVMHICDRCAGDQLHTYLATADVICKQI